jgi:hypothetical protein
MDDKSKTTRVRLHLSREVDGNDGGEIAVVDRSDQIIGVVPERHVSTTPRFAAAALSRY